MRPWRCVDVVDECAERVGVADVAGVVLDAGAAPAQPRERLAHLARGDQPAVLGLDEGRRDVAAHLAHARSMMA